MTDRLQEINYELNVLKKKYGERTINKTVNELISVDTNKSNIIRNRLKRKLDKKNGANIFEVEKEDILRKDGNIQIFQE